MGKHPPHMEKKKTTIDKLVPFMSPFNKIHLHSHLTTLFKNKDEQLPHAKQSLHLQALTIVLKH